MNERSAEGFATREQTRARRALWIIVAVAVMCVAQVSWWIVFQMRQADRMAELRRAELQLQCVHIATELAGQISSLWSELDTVVMDSNWTGGVPRTLLEHALVLSVNRFPTVTRRIQSPFGHYNMDNWTWQFQGPVDTLFVTLDPAAVAKLVEVRHPDFEFRGQAPYPGAFPFVVDPPPVRPKVETLERVEKDRRDVLVMFGSAGGLFVLLTMVGLYLIFRALR